MLASALSHALRVGAICHFGRWVVPDNMVGILPEPEAALWCQLIAGNSLLADSGTQESKTKLTSVFQKRSEAKKALAILLY